MLKGKNDPWLLLITTVMLASLCSAAAAVVWLHIVLTLVRAHCGTILYIYIICLYENTF